MLLFIIGEFGAIFTGFIMLLHWRRDPPRYLNAWTATALLVGVGAGLTLLIEYVVTDALRDAIGYNASHVARV